MGSQISLDVQQSPPRASLVQPEQPEQPGPQPPLQKQLSLNRPEVLMQAYLAKKKLKKTA
jgi:hypothetical protein